MGIDNYPEQFDPRLPTDASSQKLNKLIYSGLLKKDDNLNLIPDVAKSYNIKNPVTYTFILRDNVTFHHQKQLTSQDVKATYESMMGNKIKSPFKGSLSIIQAIDTPDNKTVIFRLKRPNSPFLTLMTLGILPAEYVKKGKNLAGSGPFKLMPQNGVLNRVKLAKFEQYYGKKAKIKKIIFRVVQDATLRTLELIKGRIDLIQNGIPYVLINKLKHERDLKFQTDTGINFTYMAFNMKNKYLKDIRVRKAIAHAIDRRKIIIYKLAGLAGYADSLISPRHWAYDNKLTKYDFNLKKAKELLDQTPYKDPDGDGQKSRFTLIYKTSSVKERLEIAQLIAESLRKIGIDVIVKSYEFGTFYRDIRQGDFDIYTLTWVGLSDPDIYYYVFHSSMIPPKGANRGHYINNELDKLLDESRIEMNRDKLIEIYNKIQTLVYNEYVYAPLWYENNFVFMKNTINGYKPRADASYTNLVNAYKMNE